ncbi:MAG: hypothetical protein M3P70_17055 [Actinomycetota bacterium]|nr:hypothetical protein [Actinomycetota bacterium]
MLDAVGSSTGTAPLALQDGRQIGTVLLPGYGDDAYPVEVRHVTDARGHQRIAELRVRFIEDALPPIWTTTVQSATGADPAAASMLDEMSRQRLNGMA